MCTFANSEDLDECGISSGPTLFLDKNEIQRKIYFFLIITCDPLINIMKHLKFIASNQKEEYISALMVREAFGHM